MRLLNSSICMIELLYSIGVLTDIKEIWRYVD